MWGVLALIAIMVNMLLVAHLTQLDGVWYATIATAWVAIAACLGNLEDHIVKRLGK